MHHTLLSARPPPPSQSPCRWKGLKKRMLNRREQLASLQQAEAVEIRRKSDAFGDRVEEFRAFFQKKAPFAVDGGVLKLEMVRGRFCLGAGGGRVAAAGIHHACCWRR